MSSSRRRRSSSPKRASLRGESASPVQKSSSPTKAEKKRASASPSPKAARSPSTLRSRKKVDSASVKKARATEHPLPSITTVPTHQIIKGLHSPVYTNPPPRNYSHAYKIHQHVQAAPLDHEHGHPQDFGGLVNLGIMMLLANTARLFVENWLKYGWIITLPFTGRQNPANEGDASLLIPSALFAGIMAMAVLFAFVIEKVAVSVTAKARRTMVPPAVKDMKTSDVSTTSPFFWWTEALPILFHLSNMAALISSTCYITYYHVNYPPAGLIVMVCGVVLMMKLASYCMVNFSLRQQFAHGVPDTYQRIPTCPIPTPFRWDDLSTFGLLPRCVHIFVMFIIKGYQPYYPKHERSSARKRWTYILVRFLELMVCIVSMYVITLQYIWPLLFNSMDVLNEGHALKIFERVLKLSLISTMVWLIGFYALFHSFLNLLAEILQFGDRQFYRSWWNATSAEDYWRLWNTPVYYWFKRHVYLPLSCGRLKLPKMVCFILAFLISAVGHELLIAFPFRVFTGWAFMGMALQIPLVILGRFIHAWRGKQSTLGNCVFWLFFVVLGQPLAVLLYYHAYIQREIAYNGKSLAQFQPGY